MQLNIEQMADHADRIANTFLAVQCVMHGDRVDEFQHVALRIFRCQRLRLCHDALKIVVGDVAAIERQFDADGLRDELRPGDVDNHAFDCLSGHLLGGGDGCADGVLHGFHVGHEAVADAFR